MRTSEFDEAYEDLLEEKEDRQRLGESVLAATIRALDPHAAISVEEQTPVGDAIRLMLDRGIGAVLVVRDGRVVGIFTERDVMRRVVSAGMNPSRPVADAMTPDPETLGLDDGIAYALNRMVVGGFRHVPILDDEGHPIAMLSQRDVVTFIVAQLPAHVVNLPPHPGLEAHSPDGG
jgi:CBS domain-containing protein